MKVSEREITIPRNVLDGDVFGNLAACCGDYCKPGDAPVRFVVTETDERQLHCEYGVMSDIPKTIGERPSIFEFKKRAYERQDKFTAALLIPTGIGAQLGGHAGDGNALARYLGSCCDTLITHPNVVNASDINELPENGLYVEGSVITRLLMGTAGLRRSRSNRILAIMDRHPEDIMLAPTVNAAGVARIALGADIVDVVALNDPVRMSAEFSRSGRAVGEVANLETIFDVLDEYGDSFDALALASVIDFPEENHKIYLDARGDMVNPWGGVEAMLTHAVSHCYNIPSAHAPMMPSSEILATIAEVVDPRMAAEELSCAFIHCVFKGLQRAPRIIADPAQFGHDGCISAMDVNCLIIPDKCIGLPTLAAMKQGIPVIAVRENDNEMKNDLANLPFSPGQLITVDTYIEAAGVMAALKAGVSLESIRRPLKDTELKIR